MFSKQLKETKEVYLVLYYTTFYVLCVHIDCVSNRIENKFFLIQICYHYVVVRCGEHCEGNGGLRRT